MREVQRFLLSSKFVLFVHKELESLPCTLIHFLDSLSFELSYRRKIPRFAGLDHSQDLLLDFNFLLTLLFFSGIEGSFRWS